MADLESESAVGPRYRVGPLGTSSRFFYRTCFATQAVASTCRAKSVSQGLYDPNSQKTFIVYSAGIKVQKPPCSAVNPTIIAYNHVRKVWEGPVQLEYVRDLPGALSDCHNYPQVLLGSDGRVHVFHTFHNSLLNIRHYVSRVPGSILGGWETREIPKTGHNTYGGAFRSNRGHLYVFFRSTYYAHDPGKGQDLLWYEPEMYVKSEDDGRTWSDPVLLIDPGRPTASNDTEAADITQEINDSGWNTIYVEDMIQDIFRDRLAIDFASTYSHGKKWGNRYFIYFDMADDKVYTVNGTCLGRGLGRPEYAGGGCTVYSPPANLYADFMNLYQRAMTHAIVIEDPSRNRFPTVYYTRFESSYPDPMATATELYYANGWDRLKKTYWNGTAWVDGYASGVADPKADPLVGVHSILDAEYRADRGTDLYLKTKWGGTRFWEDANGNTQEEYQGWQPEQYFQFPLRVFNSQQGWNNGLRLFDDNPSWEVRGVSNFNLIPGGHPSIRAFLKVPKYSATFRPGASFAAQPPIGADYVLGESEL